jgi:glycine/D-amino acid oxidase-like deaminating enzyme/nitrite reductase/ring-hydroxylating ferredoxin subunit
MIPKKSENGELTSGRHCSCWYDSTHAPVYPPLAEHVETEVVIIGAGIAGLSVAYSLCLEGKKVVVVEDGLPGSGESGRTTAQLVTALDDRYYHLHKLFGCDGVKAIAESHLAAIDFVESTVRQEKIDCEFKRVNGYLFLHPSDKSESLEKELEAAKNAGLEVSLLDQVPYLLSNEGPAIRFAKQAQFHPLKYLYGLCKAIEAHGGRIYGQTHASEIDHTGIVTTQGFRVGAQHIVIATNSPVNDKYAMHLKQNAYRSYVIAGLLKKDSIPHALWWDTGDHKVDSDIPPYHYVRLQPYNDKYDLVICGGEDHPIGNTEGEGVAEEGRYQLLEEWTRKRFRIGEIVYHWSGQIVEPIDSIAYIGRNPWDKDNVYIVTGDSGNGLTHGSLAGLIIPDLIAGRENKLEGLYCPGRFKLRSAGVLVKEFVGGLISYIRQKPDHPDAVQLSSILKGEGKIVEIQKQILGVYRDEENHLHFVSAACTHLGCHVKWNNDEKSWDCPCHGSRFTAKGIVVNGPANTNLQVFTESSFGKEPKTK